MPERKAATVWTEEEEEKLKKTKLYRNGERQSNRFGACGDLKSEEFSKLSFAEVKQKLFSGEFMIAKYSQQACDRMTSKNKFVYDCFRKIVFKDGANWK